jgi:hypothetical protein
MKAKPFTEAEWFMPLKANGRREHHAMPGMINGVYAIRDARTKLVLYVGESHTGRLRRTLQRHVEHWIDDRGPREFYNRNEIEMAWRPSSDPLRDEGDLIEHYCPRDNTKGFFEHCSGREAGKPREEQAAPDWAETEAPTEWCEDCEPTDAVPF